MADYLQNRSSGYYFRYTLPAPLQRLIGKRELKYSLKTSSRTVAKKKAAYIAGSLMQLAERYKGRMTVSDKELQKLVGQHVRSIFEQVRDEHIHMDTPLTVAESEEWQEELDGTSCHLKDILVRSNNEDIATIRGKC